MTEIIKKINRTRFDERSKETFKKQIKEYHKQEAEIAIRLCIKVHAKTGEWPKLEGLGTDYTGEFIESDTQITARPDFLIGDREVEITCSKVVCNRWFHEKCNKIDRMIKDGSDMVFVNGLVAEKQPEFIWLTSEQWKPFIERSKNKYGIVPMPGGGQTGWLNKNSYRFDVYWFREQQLFQPLPVLIKKLPKPYLDILANFSKKA